MNSTSIHQSNLDVIALETKYQEYYKRSRTEITGNASSFIVAISQE